MKVFEPTNAISHSKALDFMRAGKAIMTIQSKESGKHFTFRFATPKHNEEDTEDLVKLKDLPVWVSVLTHGDNTGNYAFIGTIFGKRFYHGKKSRISKDAQSVKAFDFWFRMLIANVEINLNKIELYHEGVCMCCGRKLTTPDSIDQGVGPICGDNIKRAKIARDRKIRHMLEASGVDISSISLEEKHELMGFFLGTDGLWQ